MVTLKRWIIYGVILTSCLGLGFLLAQELQEVAQTQNDQSAFRNRVDRMEQARRPDIKPGSPIWKELPDNLRNQLKALGFSPASFRNREKASITLTDLEGKRSSLSDYRDHWVLLNFWATWCPPCRFEMPSMNQLSNEFKKQPFTIIAINLQESRSRAREFVNNMELDFPVWLDRNGEVANRFHVRGVPESWLIAPGGRPVAKMDGSRDWNSDPVLQAVNQLLEVDVKKRAANQ